MRVINNTYSTAKVIQDIMVTQKCFLIGRMPGIEANNLMSYVAHNNDVTLMNTTYIRCLEQNTGFYSNIEQFNDVLKFWCDTYLRALRSCDLLFRLEFPTYDTLVEEYYTDIHVFSCVNVHLWMPWLEGKKVLVISPFEKSILTQYSKSKNLFLTGRCPFEFPNITLSTICCPNTIKGNEPFPDNNWQETFTRLCYEIDKKDFDIAILGCGSYGLPLAHYIKSIGKGAMYAGAYAQVMFGIKGKRWDVPGNFTRSYWNDDWIYPQDDEIPGGSYNVEGGCYWK